MAFYTQAETFRARYAAAVRANQVVADPLWGQPCLAFNVQIPITPAAAGVLHQLQDALAAIEPNTLHRCPADTLHVTVLWILGVRVVHRVDKRAHWQQIREACVVAMKDVAAQTERFVIRFRAVVPTDAAVIVVAEDDGQMARLRTTLVERMPIPMDTSRIPDIIHTTIFRYRSRLNAPSEFEGATRTVEPHIAMFVDRMAIREEQVYPSLTSALECEVRLI
ncbi:Uncharacterized protein OS=Microvirga lotononidis GN=MicloDRAFT_00042240 PE=4 SV=1 [Gemmata massiliana]|uniref:Uncharacterized protein n=1 Tax=Gemmata massiliana TaxID=1210884 RepID=A0A6P2CZS4_9BACT|nr:hypothetical protein [Gemmata massiliana]VTR94353.1 Uncharacterized protein OS=Microvirga lotononidis GN=MicloDRAFT_00042240 PE=4 SV=1 [Gemmata massiliana]